MNMKFNKSKLLLVILGAVFSLIAKADELKYFKPIIVDTTPPEYNWISTLSSGPSDTSILDDSPDGVRGRFYRLVFIEDDDVFTRPIMRIDEISYADAGCCWSVQESSLVDFDALNKAGVQMPPPELSGIDSVSWIDANTAKIMYGERECTISAIGSVVISAVCQLKKTQK
ncbi:MAG: hypothetical protein WBL62_04020 [Gallionella sp.]